MENLCTSALHSHSFFCIAERNRQPGVYSKIKSGRLKIEQFIERKIKKERKRERERERGRDFCIGVDALE